MRAVADRRETVIEFPARGVTYRLILKTGTGRFELERLASGDSWRPWIQRWEPFGVGLLDENRVVRHASTATGGPLAGHVVGMISAALAYLDAGPIRGRVYHA
jgi:hypothetical protein